MSRRRGGLSPGDLQALKHLPAVLTALEHLQEQHAKVRALMGVPDPHEDLSAEARRTSRNPEAWLRPPYPLDMGRGLVPAARDVGPPDNTPCTLCGRTELPHLSGPETCRGYSPPRTATLDTPERREYEEAKKSGRTVLAVDPFANASPAQRERMEEQRAFLLAQGRGRAAVAPPAETSEPTDEAAVRTEPLDTLSDGTAPLADDADEEVH